MKSICICFQVHEPMRLRRYRFFDIGNKHDYCDDDLNKSEIQKTAREKYIPANQELLKLIKKSKGQFKLSLSISGTAIELFELYAPEVLDSFRSLAETGQVEFTTGTIAHSLASLADQELFRQQVKQHRSLIEKHFGQKSKIFSNTDLIYSDLIGETLASLGFKAILAGGLEFLPELPSTHIVHYNAINPGLKVLPVDMHLTKKLISYLLHAPGSKRKESVVKLVKQMAEIESEQFIVVYLNYQLIELKNNFQLFSQFVNEVARHPDLSCSTPSGIIGNIRPHATIHAPEPISFNFLNQGISSFTHNELQIEASNQLYGLIDQMKGITDNNLMKDWNNLQVIDHFYYMDTSFFDDDNASKFNNPYDSPYDAFINYMNILNDFKLRIGQNTENTQA